MMLPSINMMSAAADSTAVKSDELQRSTTSISDTTPTDIEDIPSDTFQSASCVASAWQTGIYTITYWVVPVIRRILVYWWAVAH